MGDRHPRGRLPASGAWSADSLPTAPAPATGRDEAAPRRVRAGLARRGFLRAVGMLDLAGALAACGQQ
jgi:hypothetical protein